MSIHTSILAVLATATLFTVCAADTLVFSDDFTSFDLSVWQHEITLGGGGNWEFEWSVSLAFTPMVSISVQV
jgi:hypothetical protein